MTNIICRDEVEIIIVRQGMLSELYGAHLWKTIRNVEILITSSITQINDDLLNKIQGKTVLIVGNYYNMESIIENAKGVVVFINDCNVDWYYEYPYIFLTYKQNTGFLSWTVNELNIQEEHIW